MNKRNFEIINNISLNYEYGYKELIELIKDIKIYAEDLKEQYKQEEVLK